MVRPQKRGRWGAKGLLKKDLLKTKPRHSFSECDKGIVIGLFASAKKQGVPFNGADAARFVHADRSVVSRTIADFKSGILMPPTQPAALSEQASAKKALIAKRRPEVKRVAIKRVRADDGTVRAEYPTQEMIRTALPPALRPKSVATISRDLRAEKVFLRSTVRSPCLGPEWKKLRKDYCTVTPKNFPESTYAELLLVADESLLHLNNVHSCQKEYRTDEMEPMQVKVKKYPPSVMVYTAVSKKFRMIKLHVQEEADDDGVVFKTKAKMVEADIANGGKPPTLISATKKYSMAELRLLSKKAQQEWMDLERRFHAPRKGKGVNRFAHCHQCLANLHAGLGGKDHVILEDNAKIHTSCYTQLYREHLGLKFIPGHPADSADLNPCEHVFARLKKEVAFSGPPTKADLIKAIEREFRKIPQKDIDAWIDSYWTRMEACRKKNGDWVGERECRPARDRRR